MKRVPLDRWVVQLQPPRNPRLGLVQQRCPYSHETRAAPRRELQERRYRVEHQWQCQRRSAATSKRKASSAAAAQVQERDDGIFSNYRQEETDETRPLNSPSPKQALRSAKLSALHARLSLPSKLPIQTLARCLVDGSVDPRPGYNNEPLALIGQDLLGYYTAEWLLCRYPRLPMPILFAAQYAYVGSQTLAAMRAEWGVEVVAAPGPEVDPGLLQLKRLPAGNAMAENDQMRSPLVLNSTSLSHSSRPTEDGSSVEAASASFIRALAGALYLHAGQESVKAFHQNHVLSRHLPLHTLFHFTHPTRDVSRLCAREGFEPPVARLISETGRLSRSPVFVVGVYSGDDKLGEGAGSSLNEGRVRAAASALRSWYLYSPVEDDVVLPSEAATKKKQWKPQMIDIGEVVT
ncbi:60S ribosomal protein L3 [Neohortaea acidophila]|uniref:Large ribosomal subunit protein mL44 n=1 Tax=Neohortaea acidophila TaxID=245834 RepID=A0A6A6PJ94_9PEZI|nr:60S ribosomal protein L3 [Neohortaea acidophila]KAF2479781.1 60S ribosomal protein L3 [Neohortaea acidophila]